MAKLLTLLLASVLLHVAKGFSSLEKELPSLTREKRLSDVPDEPGEDDATEIKVHSKEGGNNRFNIHTNVDDHRSMYSGSHLYSHDQDESKMKDMIYRQKNNEIHITRQNVRDNREQESPLSPKTNQEAKVHSHLNENQHHKVILREAKFGWLSQEGPRAPPPSEEMQHQMRMRMKRKKRRRLRALKRISESEASKQQTGERKKTPESLKNATVKSAQENTQKKSPVSFSSLDKMSTDAQTTNPDSSSLKSTEKTNVYSSVSSNQLKKSKEREPLTSSYSPSSLMRPKRIPLDGGSAATNRFSSLEITLKSKIMSLSPKLSSSSKIAKSSLSTKSSSADLLSSSLIDEMPAEDILSSFFQHAGSAGTKEQGDATNPRSKIPNKPSEEIRRPAQPKHIYAKNTRQEKRDQGDDDYELKLLEFQKKAIEEEEKRLKEQFRPERQNIEVNKESTLERLDRKNNDKENEVQLLFEKFKKTDKQNTNNYFKQSTLDQNAAKRSFGKNTNFLINKFNDNDLDDGNDGGVGVGAEQTKTIQSSRQRRKMSKPKDKETVEKQRTINAGGGSGNDDEITEVAFYDKQDDLTNHNENIDGLTHSRKDNNGKEWDSNEGGKHVGIKDKTISLTNRDNDESAMLVKNNIIQKPKDIQNRINLREPMKLSDEIEERKIQNNNDEQKNRERLQDQMENEDLMESKEKQYREENGSRVEVDISKQQPLKLQNNKSERRYGDMESTDSMESSGKKGTDKTGVEIEVVSDNPNPPIFTEIKDEEQESNDEIEANEKKSESLDTERKKETADYHDVSVSKTNDDNNKVNSSTSGDSRNSDNNSSSKQEIRNEDNDDVMLHDNRLMYILTGEGVKPPKQRNTEHSNNVKEMTSVKEGNRDRETEKTRITQMNNDVEINNEKPLVQKKTIINKGLKSKIKEMHDRILNAHNRVSRELEQMEQELSTKFETLQESMSMAKTLTNNIDSKLNNSVLTVMNLAASSAKQAKTKLELVQKAAAALSNIEAKIGANETRNFAKILKHKLPDLSAQKNKTYQKIMAINNVITKMDGARLIALDKANTSYNAKATIEDSVSKVAGNVLDELKSTERELNDDTEMEIEDEIEADRKIRDAKTRNYRAAVKTAQALQKIEGYLKQLENDENRLRALES